MHSLLANAKWIVLGARWYDTDRVIFYAHAAGLCVDQESGRIYWFGEYKVEGQVEGGGTSVYTSDDLATWTSHELALTLIQNHTYISNRNRIQRPKHADDDSYSWLLQGLATSPNIAGPYTFVSATSPLGNWSQDFGAFIDYKSGRSYALYSNGDSLEGRDVYLSRFNNNLIAVEEFTYRFPKYDLEAPTVIQTERSYYALMSHNKGYRPNNVVAMRADKLEGPWSQPFFVSPAYTRTFSTQSGFSWRINGTKKTSFLYMGGQSRNVWLHIEIDEREGSLKVVWHDVYDLNVVKLIKGKTYISKHAELSGNAYLQEAKFGSQNVIATKNYGNDSKVTFTIEGYGADQWVSFHHQNIDDMGFGDQPQGQPDRINGTWQLRRINSVIVNGDEEKVYTLYQKDTHKEIILSSPLLLPLKERKNTITVGGLWNGHDYRGADLDRIVVYQPENRKRKRTWYRIVV
ncbi:glycosyl hydrolase [Aspergillus foveolatus]|uniref:glycosyl hydrolase n=1 Tax=Aspergillus foveolatus TaxID=210207 RepID=UPI003CCCBF16